jgi:hypothetical protein
LNRNPLINPNASDSGAADLFAIYTRAENSMNVNSMGCLYTFSQNPIKSFLMSSIRQRRFNNRCKGEKRPEGGLQAVQNDPVLQREDSYDMVFP